MKIGIDARMFGSKETGIGNYAKNLIENLKKIDHKNKYAVFMLKDRIDELDVSGYSNWRKIPVNSHWYTYGEQTKFLLDLYREKLDFIHFANFNVPILYRKPFIVTIHDIIPMFFPGHKMNSFVRRTAFKLTFYNAVRSAKHIISVSKFTKSQIMEYFNVKEDKISPIYLGLDENFNKGIKCAKIEEIKKKYGITKPYIFFVSVWRNHKNVVGLVKAFEILRRKYKQDIQLVLGGKEDPYYPEVRNAWEELKVGEHIIRPGFISGEELPSFFKGAQVSARPSFIEGFILVELEAMSAGIPIAASNASCLPELLENAAIYFDPLNPEDMAEKINKVLIDKDLREKLVENGYKQLEKYSWKKCAEETLNIYQKQKNENQSR